MAETPENEPRLVPLEQEKPPQTGSIQWDYRLLWLGLAVFIGLVGFYFAGRIGQTIVGVLWFLLTLAMFFWFVYMPLFGGGTKSTLSKGEEVGERLFFKAAGWNRFVGQDAAIGEMFDSADKPVDLVDRKQSKLVGKIDFKPYAKHEGSPPVGIAYDRRTRGFSMTFWVAGTPLTHLMEEEKRRREAAFAHTLDAMSPAGSNVGRISWRTQTLLGEPIDTNLIRKVVGRTDGAVPAIGLLDEVAAELSQTSTRPITTMTLTVHKQDLRHEKRKAGGYEAALWDEAERFLQVARDETTLFSAASPLTFNQLVGMTRLIADPIYVERMNPGLMGNTQPSVLFDPRLALPRFYDFGPEDMAQVGNTCHAYFYVMPLERTPVTRKDFLTIHRVKVPKTITNVAQVLSRKQALRRAQFSANAAHSGIAERVASGARVSGTTAVMAEETAEAETDLVRGKHMYERERLYVDITGSNPAECTAHVEVFQRAIGLTNLSLYPCLGTQSEAFRASILIGAGLESIPLPRAMKV